MKKCFHRKLQQRQKCQIFGCFQKWPELYYYYYRRDRRELIEAVDEAMPVDGGEAGDDEEEIIVTADNTVLKPILTPDGVSGGLDFKNLLSDLVNIK